MTNRRLCTAALAAMMALLGTLPACSSDPGAGGNDTGGAGTGAGGAAPIPAKHRPEAIACPAERPAGNPSPAQPGDECAADTDCTGGTNGRCIGVLGAPNQCSYDACQSDADCSASTLCLCRDPASPHANVCVPADCHVDADCGPGGYCSPGIEADEPGCSPVTGYHCHHPGDACYGDTGCSQGDPTLFCLFAKASGRWSCGEHYCGLQ